MKHFSWSRRASILPLSAAGLSVFAGVYLYFDHVRSRVTASIREAAAEAGLQAQFRVGTTWPGEVRLYDVAIAPRSGHVALRLASVDVRYSPAFGTPRRIDVSVEHMRSSLRVQDSFVWKSELSLEAELATISSKPRTVLRSAKVSAHDGTLHTSVHRTRGLELQLEMNARTADEPAEVPPGLGGTVSLRGTAGAALLELLRAEAAVRWLFPNALGAPFRAQAELMVTAAGVRLDDVEATCGELAITGEIAWASDRPNGALLLETGDRQIGLLLEDGVVQPNLTPGPEWLLRHVRGAHAGELTSHAHESD